MSSSSNLGFGIKSLFGSGSISSKSLSWNPKPDFSLSPSSSSILGSATGSSSSRLSKIMKTTKSNKPVKTFKNLNKILGGRKGSHRNRPIFGGLGPSFGRNDFKHWQKKDKAILTIFLGLVALVILSLGTFGIVKFIKNYRARKQKARAIGGLPRSQDIENGNPVAFNLQENGVTESSVNLDGGPGSQGEKVTYITGGDLSTPSGNWGQSDHTLSADTTMAKAGSTGCESCTQNMSTGCEYCLRGSPQSTTPTVMQKNVPEVTSSSLMTTVLPELAPSSPFVDAEETIGLADGGSDTIAENPTTT